MKLKRFLLRYEPPGVGLEVEESGKLSVVHKDLPSEQKVNSMQDIHGEVERLIEGDDILSKRKHTAALTQLLCRLYRIDESAEPTDRPVSPASPANEEPKEVLRERQEVVIVGLKQDKTSYNGELGIITKARPDKDKYDVEVVGKDKEPLKKQSIVHFVPLAGSRALACGTQVAIRGLRNHVELNGCFGRIVECHEDTQRYEVRATDTGQLFRVKQENLVPIDPLTCHSSVAGKENVEPNKKNASAPASAAEPSLGQFFRAGTEVMLVDLKTAKQYNGQAAEVLSVDNVRGRYEIRLGDGSVKTVRAENVRKL